MQSSDTIEIKKEFEKIFRKIPRNTSKIVAIGTEPYVLCNDAGKMRFFKLI